LKFGHFILIALRLFVPSTVQIDTDVIYSNDT